MRHALRNVLVNFFHYAGIARVYRRMMRRHGPLTRCIVFHDIHSGSWFASLIEELVRTTRVLTPSEFRNGVRDRKKLNVLITFDDGYASWITHALPVLSLHGIHGLFFVNSGMLDLATSEGGADAFMREKLMIRPRAPLTWEGARTLLERGHSIGGHARMHENLSRLRGDALTKEIQEDKERIESMLSVTLTDFAYPFGTREYYTQETQSAVERAGYARGYTAVSRFVHLGETFSLSRMCIEDDATPQSLRRWLFGAYDLVGSIKTLFK